MRALITGHMGVIGRHFARYLKNQGWSVHVCAEDIEALCDNNTIQYDLVVHTIKDPHKNDKFWKWIEKTSPHGLIFMSSEDVYPTSAQQEPTRLVEGQGSSTDEMVALSLGGYVFRPFQVYGEGARGVFEQLWRMTLGRLDPFRAPGCGRVMDFIHVNDVVLSAMAAYDQGQRGPINLCTGEPTAVDELAQMMFQVVEWHPQTLVCDSDLTLFFRCGDVTLMNEIRPATISLSKGILMNMSKA